MIYTGSTTRYWN